MRIVHESRWFFVFVSAVNLSDLYNPETKQLDFLFIVFFPDLWCQKNLAKIYLLMKATKCGCFFYSCLMDIIVSSAHVKDSHKNNWMNTVKIENWFSFYSFFRICINLMT